MHQAQIQYFHALVLMSLLSPESVSHPLNEDWKASLFLYYVLISQAFKL